MIPYKIGMLLRWIPRSWLLLVVDYNENKKEFSAILIDDYNQPMAFPKIGTSICIDEYEWKKPNNQLRLVIEDDI